MGDPAMRMILEQMQTDPQVRRGIITSSFVLQYHSFKRRRDSWRKKRTSILFLFCPTKHPDWLLTTFRHLLHNWNFEWNWIYWEFFLLRKCTLMDSFSSRDGIVWNWDVNLQPQVWHSSRSIKTAPWFTFCRLCKSTWRTPPSWRRSWSWKMLASSPCPTDRFQIQRSWEVFFWCDLFWH